MPLKLTAPLEKTFVLERSDELFGNDGDPTKVAIRQATQKQHEHRQSVVSEVTRVMKTDRDSTDVILRQNWSLEELKRTEVYLTMVDCNILKEDSTPLFKFKKRGDTQYLDMTVQEFQGAWGILPIEIAGEIHEKVLEVNVSWGGPLESEG